MTSVHYNHRTRRAFVPLRKAAMDAFLLTALIFIGSFAFPQIILSYTWVFLPIYALVYFVAVALRLRQAARETVERKNPYNYLFH